MVFSFTKDELEWLSSSIELVKATVKKKKPENEQGWEKKLSRLKYKFTPNAHQVFLKRDERSLLLTLALKRESAMSVWVSLGSEYKTVKSIIDKVSKQS